jgi:hypothetical protein
MNNYIPFQKTQNSITSNNTPQHNLFSNINFNTYFPQSNTNLNNINNKESKKINNLFTNINSNSLSFSKKQFPDENCNNNCDTSNNYDGLSINLNHSFCSSSNSYKGLSLSELENKNDNIVKSIVYQEAICKESQQVHINALCESLKTEMLTFQQYQKKELQINVYIESMQNLFKNQINQISDMNNQLEKLKSLVYQQAKVAKLIDEAKNGQNNVINNLFNNQLII